MIPCFEKFFRKTPPPSPLRRFFVNAPLAGYCILLASLIITTVLPLRASAGGGPETTLVVVNEDSPLSLYIANEYIRMREIPLNHVVWLRDIPTMHRIEIEPFRSRIWRPIREHITSHHLEEEIDAIIYSADFPYAVRFAADVKKNRQQKKQVLGSVASLTGLTYFARRVEIGDTGYLGVNRYFRRDRGPRVLLPRAPTEQEIAKFKDAKKALNNEDYQGAVTILQPLVKSYPWSNQLWYGLAQGLAATGKDDDAMTALAKAVDTGWSFSMYVKSDKHLQGLRNRSDFAALLKRMHTMTANFQPARGFRSHYIWTGNDNPLVRSGEESLDRYYLSTLLAYTGVRGNNIPGVMAYLRASVSSDGSFPEGTVYLMENRDVRSTTRQRYFKATVEALAERGRNAEILTKTQDGENGIIPQNRKDVIGAVVGVRRFDWGRSGSRLLPGAIAESLTSYGGDFNRGAQTKLTEFLRHGAAGSSGAVAEPYALQAKFPVSYIHVHYADGSSLAEAFYQSVEAPYQLIIVGDPLARPFAHFPHIRLVTPDPAQDWRGTVSLQPFVEAAEGHPIERIELWVDGQYVDSRSPGVTIPWDTATVEDGSHDLRLVAVEAGPIETRSYLRIPVTVANHDHRVQVDRGEHPVSLGDTIILSGTAPDARRVKVFHGVRMLGTADVKKGRWTLAVPSQLLGPGTVSLLVKGEFRRGRIYRSRPVVIRIEEPPFLAASNIKKPDSTQGLKAAVRHHFGKKRDVVITQLNGHLSELGKNKKNVSSLELEGQFHVGKTGFYQLNISTRGKIRIEIDNSKHIEAEQKAGAGDLFVPLGLESGWHDLNIILSPDGRPRLQAVLTGTEDAAMLAGDMLRH